MRRPARCSRSSVVDNKKNELLPGAYAEVHFNLPAGRGGDAFKLPANVLLFRGDGMHVATVDAKSRVVMKPSRSGATTAPTSRSSRA